MKHLLHPIVGWYGAIVILLAFMFINFDIIAVDTILYQLMNITGALALIYYSASKKDYPTSVLNVFWAFIAIIAITKLF
ncbi:MAG: hypothetical protein AUJ23_01555 [Candidatus Magasanikbacteria bacterium CG1_02_32_51]|uniref:CBU-0592-like domain-containing protein n=1 Tax=Candidatus Magasanikbacteria bacterium CG1_02_32_51 TaxID=1805238 RepID=A0A1J4U8V0_9BACT|nr:MAG: hypothetical protein AUJ23_01555 [Candidatus Magasanikbacteria bacterium CG1_02_32_51]